MRYRLFPSDLDLRPMVFAGNTPPGERAPVRECNLGEVPAFWALYIQPRVYAHRWDRERSYSGWLWLEDHAVFSEAVRAYGELLTGARVICPACGGKDLRLRGSNQLLEAGLWLCESDHLVVVPG